MAFYKVLRGKQKGKILNLDESDFDYETGMVTDEDGKRYYNEDVAPLTKEEQERCLRVEEIPL